MPASTTDRSPHERAIGPWLVALGAGLWGTESAWRIPLNDLFAPEVIVWWEHVVLVALALPFIIPRLGELKRVPRSALAWLVFSGIAGSAIGTVFFTLALKYGNPTIVNVVPNLQPVLSTAAAYFLFKDRLAKGFFAWAPIAIVAGLVISYTPPTAANPAVIDAGTGYALICALFWGLATVAGRGVMVSMSTPLASGLRLVVGLICMTIIIAVNGQISSAALWPAAAAADSTRAIGAMLLLAVLSGGIPLLIYFRGLALTRASTAGYFEMVQTVVGVIITWRYFDGALEPYQLAAGLALIGAVAMVQRAQARAGA
jgi:drug/metabolite transporter (DMT)-like permease